MADHFLLLDAPERGDVLQTAARKLGRQPAILEKDVWICWVLLTLFSIQDAGRMAFKGGTSLSKVFDIIDRFSEDVDITIDYRSFDDEFDPFSPGTSKTQIRKFSDRLKERVGKFSLEVIKPALQAAAADVLSPEEIDIRIDDSGEKIWFGYPSAVESSDVYMKSEVLIELGGRNVIDPNERHEIKPYLVEVTDGLEFPEAKVTVLSPKRTFWEKATLIHVECNRGRLKENPERLSRHWYDLTRLAQHELGICAMNDRKLFEDVIKHKKVFFNASYARYDECLEGRLRLLPGSEDLLGLKADYDSMNSAEMIYGEIPDFYDLADHVRDIEAKVNDWP